MELLTPKQNANDFITILTGIGYALLIIVVGSTMALMIGSVAKDMLQIVGDLLNFSVHSIGDLGVAIVKCALLGVFLGFLAFLGCSVIAVGSGVVLLVLYLREFVSYVFLHKQLQQLWSPWQKGAASFAASNQRTLLLSDDTPPIALRDFGSLLPNNSGSDKVWPLFSAQGLPRDAAWYFVGDADSPGGRVVLRVELAKILPSIAISSKVHKGERLLPTAMKNAENVPLAGDMSDYFVIQVRRPQMQEALQVLTPDVLEKILFKFDACDVEMRDSHIDIIWSAAMMDSAFIERERTVVEFIREVLEQVDTMSIDQQPHLVPRSTASNKLVEKVFAAVMASIKYVGIFASVTALLVMVLDVVGMVPDFPWVIALAAGFGVMVVWTLLVLSLFVIFAICYVLVVSVKAGYAQAQQLMMRRKYVMYYEGRV